MPVVDASEGALLADDHLRKRVKWSSGNVLLAACNAHRVDPGLQKREHHKDLPCDLALVTVRVLHDDKEELDHQVGHDEAEQRTRAHSISTMLKPTPRPSPSFVPREPVALYRFAIITSIGRNHTCCCAVARNAGYGESDSSTASSAGYEPATRKGVEYCFGGSIFKIAFRKKTAYRASRWCASVSASAIVSAAGSAVGTSCAAKSKPSSPIQPTSMTSRGTSTHY
jgi:hypothetical protein